MATFPLKFLAFYQVRKKFQSELGFNEASHFNMGQLLQYQKTTSNIHDMMEIIYFIDWNTKEELIWHVNSDELYDHWQEYLELTSIASAKTD